MEWLNGLGYVETSTPQGVILFRLFLAAVFGAIIGWERQARNGTAGLRTHILVCSAAALFTTLAFEIYYATGGDTGDRPADPIRAVEATTAGIAFLGAGAIFRSGANVQGLTTGAGMWLAGAVGVATAVGYYGIALVVSVFAVVVLSVLRGLSHRVIGSGETDAALATEEPHVERITQERGRFTHN